MTNPYHTCNHTGHEFKVGDYAYYISGYYNTLRKR